MYVPLDINKGSFPNVNFALTLSVPEKLKDSISEMAIITETLNIHNLRTTSAKSINLHTIRKLVEYSFKNIPTELMFTLAAFEILLSEGRLVLRPTRWDTGRERINILVLIKTFHKDTFLS